VRILESKWRRHRLESLKKGWYKFSRNRLSVLGLCVIVMIVLAAVFAPYLTPYSEHVGPYLAFDEAKEPPSVKHPLGTDLFGRDILTRILFGYRLSLLMAAMVIGLSAPVGVVVGLLAGYFHRTWIDRILMRITDVFLAVPGLILALAITSVLTPNLTNAAMALSIAWWTWFARLVYGVASSCRSEFFVRSAEVLGERWPHIVFREILPNCVSVIFTKISLDVGWAILAGASLGFLGLGAQPPTPDLGSMVADGSKHMPELWWMAVFPALAIVITVLGFNLIGDGLRDMFAIEEL